MTADQEKENLIETTLHGSTKSSKNKYFRQNSPSPNLLALSQLIKEIKMSKILKEIEFEDDFDDLYEEETLLFRESVQERENMEHVKIRHS